MARGTNGGELLECSWVVCGVLLFSAACGGDLTSGERWNADTEPDEAAEPPEPAEATEPDPGTAPSQAPASTDDGCEAPPIAGYEYADAPLFWLGSQAERAVAIEGAGFFVSDDAASGQGTARFSRQVLLSVAPDGSLEDRGGNTLLGHPPHAASGDSCVVPLRAPLVAAPEATTRISIRMNLDPRAGLVEFSRFDPEGTSNGSTSIAVVDSLGAQHGVEFFFNNLGGNAYLYSVVVGGEHLIDGTRGERVLVSSGSLAFTSDGALEIATVPELSISFGGGATVNQAIDVDFGLDITNDGTAGLSGTTGFAATTAVFSQSQDGHVMGTGSDVRVAPSGEVTVDFDSGATLAIGKLALARFANEDRLVPRDDGSLRATAESGPPAFGVPSSPGRGVLVLAP